MSLFSALGLRTYSEEDSDPETADPADSSGISKAYWMKDENAKECYDCKSLFGSSNGLRVCNFCIGSKEDYDSQLSRRPTRSSQDHEHIVEGDVFKMIGSSFFKSSELPSQTFVPFRRNDDIPQYTLEDEFMEFESSLPKNTPTDSENVSTPTALKALESPKKMPSRSKRSYTYPNRRINTKIGFKNAMVENEITRSWDGKSFSNPLDLGINAASVQHLRLLMRQTLTQLNVPKIDEWESVIVTMLLQISKNLKPDIRGGDDIDIRSYIKIKRIAGGKVSDSVFWNGIVISETPIHKFMLKDLVNPRIMLLTFPLQYQRIENEITSLETLKSQEVEYISNLISRIALYKPDVILVQKSISYIAQSLLVSENIYFVQNVKTTTILTIARFTQADIIHSIDKLVLKPPRLGLAKKFGFSTFFNNSIPGYKKSYAYIEGLETKYNCTLVLRGTDMEILQKVKQAARFLAYVVYNLKLETCLLQDEYATTPSLNDERIKELDIVRTDFSDPLSKAIALYQGIILSGSPLVKFPPPYLLLSIKEKDTLNHNSIFFAVLDGDSNSKFVSEDTGLARNETEESEHDSLEATPIVSSIQYLLAHADRLSPFNHQNLTFLYSHVCKSHTTPCVPPIIRYIDYYGESDMTLGQFIEDTCFGSPMLCETNLCSETMANHYKTYTHYNGKITITTESFPCPVEGMSNQILMWTFCKICSESSPIIPMSEETWKYSFGKYLEFTFYHPKVQRRASSCPHDIHSQHIRYFSFLNQTVRIEYEVVALYELLTPSMRKSVQMDVVHKLREDEIASLEKKIVVFYDSVCTRVKSFTFEIVPVEKQTDARDFFTDLLKKADQERSALLHQLEELALSISFDFLSLTTIYRKLLDNVSMWDFEFKDFIKEYLHVDTKEIRRLTAAQLKRIFADRGEDRTLKSKPETKVVSPSFSEHEVLETTQATDTSNLEDFEAILSNSQSQETPKKIIDWSSVSPLLMPAASIKEESHPSISDPEKVNNSVPEVRGAMIERGSIMKTIASLWTGNSGNFLPLEYPSNPKEHFFTDSFFIVREEEPTSIAAFALASKQYKEVLNCMRLKNHQVNLPIHDHYSIVDVDDHYADIEDSTRTGSGTHVKHQFWDNSAKLSCKIFFAEKFDTLRKTYGIDSVYEQSLASCTKWEASGGKSGSLFLKSKDNLLVIKQLTKPEMEALYNFAPSYFEYNSRALYHHRPSILAKIYGFYRITCKNATGKMQKIDIIVMENLFSERNVSRIFDLKGSIRNRHVQSTGKDNEVLLDENLLECNSKLTSVIFESPLFLREHSKKILRASVWNDTHFLAKMNVMDYSLVVGIDNDTSELIVGIVDFIRTFTWDKKLESWVKETGLFGGSGREPTIITPNQYRERFRQAMDNYFLMVPDKFSQKAL